MMVESEVKSPATRLGILPFAVTIFCGAFLLFLVQPLIGKYIIVNPDFKPFVNRRGRAINQDVDALLGHGVLGNHQNGLIHAPTLPPQTRIANNGHESKLPPPTS